uniref:Uncharacterized protein n=1 Tax=Schistocephalus solidus TaxID=70667 RepID=A0A0V0J162_SCHSO
MAIRVELRLKCLQEVPSQCVFKFFRNSGKTITSVLMSVKSTKTRDTGMPISDISAVVIKSYPTLGQTHGAVKVPRSTDEPPARSLLGCVSSKLIDERPFNNCLVRYARKVCWSCTSPRKSGTEIHRIGSGGFSEN